MSWSYRVAGTQHSTTEWTFGIIEVYHQDGVIGYWSANYVYPFGEDFKSLVWDVEQMSKCLSLPVVNYKSLEAGKLISECELQIDGNGVIKLISGISWR